MNNNVRYSPTFKQIGILKKWGFFIQKKDGAIENVRK
jgi:hypothetical protein